MAFPDDILPIRVELDIAGAWADITEYVYQRGEIVITRGRDDESKRTDPQTCTLQLNNRDGRFSPRNPLGAYYGMIGRNSALRVSVEETSGWLQINQATGDTVTPTHVSTTDKAALDIVGDIDIRFFADLDSWYDVMELVSKWTETSDERSYGLRLNADATVTLRTSPDGTNGAAVLNTSTVPLPVTSGPLAVRATLDVSNGGNKVATFYVSDSLAGSWTQLGDTVTTAGTTSIYNGTGTLHVLDNPNDSGGGSTIRGRVYGAAVLDGIGGTEVANPDFTIQDEADTSFADAAGNTWTVVGDCELTNHDMRFVGEVSSWPQRWDTTGNDVWTTVTASGPLRRLAQGSAIGSSLYRGTARNPDLVAYWSMEEGENATVLGSAVTGGKDIIPSATTLFAREEGFACSAPIPYIGTSRVRGNLNPYTTTGFTRIQFLLHVPTGGLSGGSNIITINTTGSAARLDLIYGTGSGGTLRMRLWDTNDAVLVTDSATDFDVDGTYKMVVILLEDDGADLNYTYTTYDVPERSGISGVANTMAGVNHGRVTACTLNPDSSADYDDVGMGHLAVMSSITEYWTIENEVLAFDGESATERIERLCTEEGLTASSVGDRRDSAAMGPQLSDTLLNLLNQAADADGGILFEGKDFLEIRYRSRKAIVSQQDDLTLDYATFQLTGLDPVEDDQLTKNDVTVSRIGGASARAELTSGALSTDIPPVGVGRYDVAVSLSLEDDSTLADQANWRVHLGTVDEARYPDVALTLESSHLAAERVAIAGLDMGDRITIENPPAGLDQQDIVQLVQGYTETLNAYSRVFNLNLSPGRPWDVGVYDDFYEQDRYGNGACTTTEALDTTETGVDVVTATGSKRWSATAVPYDVIAGGEIMTVTAVTGSTNSQTLTVTRSVNGVVKEHVSGVSVELVPLSYYGF